MNHDFAVDCGVLVQKLIRMNYDWQMNHKSQPIISIIDIIIFHIHIHTNTTTAADIAFLSYLPQNVAKLLAHLVTCSPFPPLAGFLFGEDSSCLTVHFCSIFSTYPCDSAVTATCKADDLVGVERWALCCATGISNACTRARQNFQIGRVMTLLHENAVLHKECYFSATLLVDGASSIGLGLAGEVVARIHWPLLLLLLAVSTI